MYILTLLPVLYNSHASKVKPMDGPLLASHGIISNVRWTLASEYSLLCVPNLFNQILTLINPLPCQGVDLIKSMEISSADPLTWRPRNGLSCKPGLAALPLLLDLAAVRSLVGILQPTGFFGVFVEKEASKERIIREARCLLGPDSLLDHGPVRFDFLPNMACL